MEEALKRLNNCFLKFSVDIDKNIMLIVETAGLVLNGACALYNRLEGNMLCTLAEWQAPKDLLRKDEAKGHLCFDIISSGKDEPIIVRDLESSSYAETDPNVKKYGLKTYIGYPVKLKDKNVGSLCVVYTKDKQFNPNEIEMLTIFGKSISIEEERKKADETFKKAQERFSGIYHASRDAIGYATPDGALVDVNESFTILTGYSKEELLSGKRYQDITPEEYHEYEAKIVKDILKTGKSYEYEKEYIRKDGSRVPILLTAFVVKDIDGKPAGVAAIIKDITERKKAEQALIEAKDDLEIQTRGLQKTNDGIRQLYKELEERTEELQRVYTELKETQMRLVQSEKLASIGIMASGVAHEINNPLAVISGEAEMLLKEKDKDRDVKEASKIILEQSKRIKTINEQLLVFSRKREPKLEPLDINKVLEELIPLLSHQVKIENIEILKEFNSGLPKIVGDKNQVREVFLNIMLNAVEAMEGKGKLTIKTYAEKIREYGRRKQDVFKLGQKIVIIEFTDTGKGMDEETLKKVFDPFFTTKEKNTGLGLSISHGIVQNHNGSIEVYSKLGEGSTFVVKLPVIK